MTMDKSQLTTCICLCFAMLTVSSHGLPVRPQQHSTTTNDRGNTGATGTGESNSLLPPVKKDVFMSRGWGASGMPFTMFYLNHYAKAQKAYAQNQQQQQQQQQIRQQEAVASRLRSNENQFGGVEQPKTLPYGARYAEPLANAQLQQGDYKEEEYSDGGVYSSPKSGSPRRQYNVPQLFVSYGWGPMG